MTSRDCTSPAYRVAVRDLERWLKQRHVFVRCHPDELWLVHGGVVVAHTNRSDDFLTDLRDLVEQLITAEGWQAIEVAA